MIVELQKVLVESGKEKLMVENFRMMVKKNSFVMSFLPARGGKINYKMASDVEEISEFLLSLNRLFNQIQHSLSINDPICMEHYKNKLEDYSSIVVAICIKVDMSRTDQEEVQSTTGHTLSSLLNNLIEYIEQEHGKLCQVIEMSPAQVERREITSVLPSGGGRPAYNITKDQIVQLKETGMNWKSIADFLGISERTLHRRRIKFGIEPSFSNISDSDLDQTINAILHLTPYSGESYIMGSLKGRGVHVQRYRVRESLRRVDPIGRSMRRR